MMIMPFLLVSELFYAIYLVIVSDCGAAEIA